MWIPGVLVVFCPGHADDAEIENFGHLHLECRYGYHFEAHGRLSRKNALGGFKGLPQKTVLMVSMASFDLKNEKNNLVKKIIKVILN